MTAERSCRAWRSRALAAVVVLQTAPAAQPEPGVAFGAGPRAGGTLNRDQWLLGGAARLDVLPLGGLALGALVDVGFGDNYVTLRPGLRAFYFFWITRRSELGLSPIAGAALVRSIPVLWDFEGPGALRGTLDARLRDVMSGLVPDVTWSNFKREVAHIVAARKEGTIDSVTVWTFDKKTELAELLYYSVDGVMTNEPGLLHEIWQETL